MQKYIEHLLKESNTVMMRTPGYFVFANISMSLCRKYYYICSWGGSVCENEITWIPRDLIDCEVLAQIKRIIDAVYYKVEFEPTTRCQHYVHLTALPNRAVLFFF